VAKREFLQLAHTYKPEKHGIAGHWTSDKLDGQRCFWDGGVSRGVPKKNVPWANTAKDARYKIPQIATGLWSRYGNVIHAPEWWLDELPLCFLDGEGYCEDIRYRQELSSIIKQLIPNSEDWKKPKFYVFGIPPIEEIFKSGWIKNVNFTKYIDGDKCRAFIGSYDFLYASTPNTTSRSVYHKLDEILTGNIVALRHQQYELDFNTTIAIKQVAHRLEIATSVPGGEGIVVRNPDSKWQAERCHSLLKVKGEDDAEAVVIGYTAGKLTDLGSKHLGYVGALIIDFRGSKMELAGLNDGERVMIDINVEHAAKAAGEDPVMTELLSKQFAYDWAVNHPGQEVPKHFDSLLIPKGSIVTIKYRGLSKDGIPQEARYWRKREDV